MLWQSWQNSVHNRKAIFVSLASYGMPYTMHVHKVCGGVLILIAKLLIWKGIQQKGKPIDTKEIRSYSLFFILCCILSSLGSCALFASVVFVCQLCITEHLQTRFYSWAKKNL